MITAITILITLIIVLIFLNFYMKRLEDRFKLIADQSTKEHMEQAARALEGERELIELHVNDMKSELYRLFESIRSFEKERSEQFGNISESMKTIHRLYQMLTSAPQRGMLGEVIAEDILKHLGFLENVNYLKQEQKENRPDFTILLPENKRLYMDVKFPFDNYRRYVESEPKNEEFKNAFFRDVKNMIDKVSKYIDTDSVNFSIIYIPTDTVYNFILENTDIYEYAFQKKVLIVNSFSLYAILSIVHSAIRSFNIEKEMSRIIDDVNQFLIEWTKFIDGVTNLGERIHQLEKEFNTLITTRKQQLEKPVERIKSYTLNK